MNSYFRESRNVELSTVYFVETSISADWSGITVIKTFVNAYKSALPVICVHLSDTQNNREEVGSTSFWNDYNIMIDIFATSDGQRIDLSDYLIDKLKDCFPYYTHSQTPGAPETLTRVETGKLFVQRVLSNHKIDFGDYGVDTADKFRHFIHLVIKKTE
jgi:hypothetical protein